MNVKQFSFLGAALAIALSGGSALAQSTTNTTGEIELSPEGFEILCERFPLNSRCSGATTSGSSPSMNDSESMDDASGNMDEDVQTRPAGPPTSPGSPDSVTVPEEPTGDTMNEEMNDSEMSPSGSSGSMNELNTRPAGPPTSPGSPNSVTIPEAQTESDSTVDLDESNITPSPSTPSAPGSNVRP